jgi:pimeloyl-ACP methyl ester carboxylesterase
MAEAHCQAHHGPPDSALTRVHAQLREAGTAQGPLEPVRLAINAATTLLAARPWGRMGQWASGKLLVADLRQVTRYLSRDEPDSDGRMLDERIRARVAAALGPGPAVVIAHSLGTVVSFEVLHHAQAGIPLFVTLGSPLAMRSVVWTRVRPQPLATPDSVERWLNFWDRDDIIVPRPILEADMAPSTAGVLPKSERVDSDGIWVHTATKYLADAKVAGPVMEALAQLRSPA